MDVNTKHTAEYIHRVIIMMTRDWHVVVQVIIMYVLTIIIMIQYNNRPSAAGDYNPLYDIS